MAGAVLWGGLAASSLLVGAALGVLHAWPQRLVGLVLAFGAGALIAAVSFELALEGLRIGGTGAVAAGLVAGSLTYYLADSAIEGRAGRGAAVRVATGGTREPAAGGASLGSALALGTVLDGIPEQLVLGIGVATRPGLNAALFTAVIVSNLPEAIGSAATMRAAGQPVAAVGGLWLAVSATCAGASVAGYALAEVTTGSANGVINGFAAGALLVMLIDSMVPAAAGKAGPTAGLATVLGFAIAAGLSTLTV